MPGLFGIFELGRHSLLAHQAALSTAGHNVANAATPGYHRQRVNVVQSMPELAAFGALGTGIRIDSVQRIEDRFIETAIQRESPLLAHFSARYEALSQAEAAFGEPSENGLNTMLDDFYGAWDDLASNPEDIGARESVIRLGAALADSIGQSRRRLADQRGEINAEIGRNADDANRMIRELAAVNRSITKAAASGGGAPGDLADARDRLVAGLGDLVGASSTIEDTGAATVRINGRVLVQQEAYEEITFERDLDATPGLSGRALASSDLEGRIGGLLIARDEDLADSIRRLDELAVRLAQDVNGAHRGGTDVHGRAAGPFFVFEGLGPDGVTGAAGALRVDSALLDDSSRLAAGSSGAPGDNSVALAIAAQRNDSRGAAGLLRSLIVDVAGRTRETGDLADTQRVIVDSFRAQQEAISGVSLDEEAADMLRFERAYQASARLMTIVDEMAQTILSI